MMTAKKSVLEIKNCPRCKGTEFEITAREEPTMKGILIKPGNRIEWSPAVSRKEITSAKCKGCGKQF